MRFRSVVGALVFLQAAVLVPLRAGPQDSLIGGDVGPAVAESGSHTQAGALEMAVQPSTGVFHANLPVSLPPARGGPQPSLTVQYSSAAGIREAGVGWGLELPAIERRGPTGGAPSYDDPKPEAVSQVQNYQQLVDLAARRVEIAKMSRFTFNGEPIVPVCEVESILSPCSTVDDNAMPDWVSKGWFYFRLENDTAFSRIFWSPDRATWRVQIKGGQILEFGQPMVWPQPKGDNGIDDDQYFSRDTVSGALLALSGHYRWNLVRQFSPSADGGEPQNVILNLWERLGDTGRGYLTDIYYTPPADASTERSPVALFAHHVHLVWERPQQVRNSYAPIWRAVPDYVLTSIDVTSKPFRNGRASREMVRRYRLGYSNRGRRSFLTSFQEEGRCTTQVPELSTGFLPATTCPRLPATKLTYSELESNRTPQPVLLMSPPGAPPRVNDDSLHLIPIDINGDSLRRTQGGLPRMDRPKRIASFSCTTEFGTKST